MVLRELNKWNNIKNKCKYKIDKPDFDSLYFDMNGLISDKLHELETDNLIDKIDDDKLIKFVFEKIDIIIHQLKPRKLLGIFIDGVPPKAKMNIQRQRRIREFYKYHNKYLIQQEKNNDYIWKNIKVVFSGPNVAGEAENKIMKHIKENYQEKTCVYTTDSDFYLYLLSLHRRSFFIYNSIINEKENNTYFSIDFLRKHILNMFKDLPREDQNKVIDDFICIMLITENNYLPGIHDVLINDLITNYVENYTNIGFINCNGKLNEKHLKKYFSILNENINIINKMIFLLDNESNSSNKVYNDEFLDNNNSIIKFELVNNYSAKKDIFINIQRLCNDPELKYKNFNYNSSTIEFLKYLCTKLNLEFIDGKFQIKIIDVNNKKKTYKENDYWNFKDYCNKNNLDLDNLVDLDSDKEYSFKLKCKEFKIKYNKEKYISIKKNPKYEEDYVNNFNNMKLSLNTNEKNKLFEEQKKSYYERNIPNCNIYHFVNQYIEGIKWILKAIYDDIPSWSWNFEPRYWRDKCNSYGPFISELCNFKENEYFQFEKGEPLSPFEHMLTILPYESSDLLPSSYRNVYKFFFFQLRNFLYKINYIIK
ncbi:XRN 5'-3' exonuclease N-terminus-domain-containing protein [Neocallimastix sp. 'constans']